MRVLLVDDVREVEAPEAVEVAVARTAIEGLKLLQDGAWDLVLLDHDLGASGDIRPLVRFLEESAFHGRKVDITNIVVVSSNPPGARWIAQGLERYYDVVVRPAGPRIGLADWPMDSSVPNSHPLWPGGRATQPRAPMPPS